MLARCMINAFRQLFQNVCERIRSNSQHENVRVMKYEVRRFFFFQLLTFLNWFSLSPLSPHSYTHTHAHITHTHEIRSFQKAGERREKKHVAICICSAEFNMSRAGGAFLLGPIPWRHIHLWEMVGRTKEDCPHGSAQACLNTRARSRTQISTVAKHTHTHIYSTCTQMHVFTQTQSSDRDRLV